MKIHYYMQLHSQVSQKDPSGAKYALTSFSSKFRQAFMIFTYALLVLLFVYTPFSKWGEFEKFSLAMRAQPLPSFLMPILIYLLPVVELLTAVLTVIPKTRILALYLGTILMTLFTGYTALILVNYFDSIPCSCGGIFEYLTWGEHLTVNSFVLLCCILSIFFYRAGNRPRVESIRFDR